MKPRNIIFISMIAIFVVAAAGYYGFSGSSGQEPTPEAPQTAGVTICDVQQTVTAPGELHNTSETQFLMPVDGSLAEVLVQAGDPVSAGQVLARLDDTSKAEAQIALKEAQGAYQTAYSYRKSLDGKIWLQRITYRGDGPRQVPVIHWYKGYADQETIADAEDELALKKAQLDAAQAALDQMELKAPFDGIVIEAEAVAHQPIHADETLFTITDPMALEVRANVTQEDYPLLKPGQRAEVYFTARPDITAQGMVTRIIPKLIEGSTPTYDIFISLDEVPDRLADGMTVDTSVTIASRTGVLCLPRSVVHASSDNRAVLQVWNGAGTESREVTVGLRGDADVEIVSGLEEGDQVVVR
jgi:macrolide-specific efflux system membrane fusion protein